MDIFIGPAQMLSAQGGAAGCWLMWRASKKDHRTRKIMLLLLLSLIHQILKIYLLFVYNKATP